MGIVTVDRHESELGVWTSTAWTPAVRTPLSGAIERIWHFDGTLGAARERVFPDATLELIVQLDTPHRPGTDRPADPFPPLCVTGIRTTAEVVEAPPGRTRVLGLRLTPTAASRLLGVGLTDLTACTVDLLDVIGRPALEFGTRVYTAGGGAAAVRAVAAWAEDRIAQGPAPDATVERALAKIRADGGARSLAELEAWQGRSRARFNAAFREAVGVSPKRLARIVRFDRALCAIGTAHGSLSTIAHAAGYYDQAHFTNEFREHAGVTPRAYLHARRYPGGANLVDEPEHDFEDLAAAAG